MSSDRYLTLAGHSEGLYREKASKFLAFAFPIADEEDFKQQLTIIAKMHHASRHVCYAWVLGNAGDRYRANDAGEPSGTAGKPILRQLQGQGITNAAIVVVRYFGGTLLGKGGLVNAYAGSAKDALTNNTVVEQIVRKTVTIACTYAQVEAIRSEVLSVEGEVMESTFGERCILHLALPLSSVERFAAKWSAAGANVEVDQAK